MRIINESSHPTAAVERIVRAGWTGRDRARVRDLWDRTPVVVVHRRVRRDDDREGFTPFDHSQPEELWVEDSDRYPQPGARDWQEELLLSAAHERYHYDDPGSCPHGSCEVKAEAQAHRVERRLRGILPP